MTSVLRDEVAPDLREIRQAVRQLCDGFGTGTGAGSSPTATRRSSSPR